MRLLWLVLLTACNAPAAKTDAGVPGPDAALGEDFEMQAADFECVTRWPQVRNYRITNKLGHTDAAVAIATADVGGNFPVGTLIQLVPFEAMIKRRAGFDPVSNDWEFFALQASASGTKIVARGTSGVVNQFGGNCLDCHKKAVAKWDFICETGHGCDTLPLTSAQILSLQNNDARCP